MTIEDALEEMAREAELKRLEEEKKGIVSPANVHVVVPESVDLDKLVFEPSKTDELQFFNDSLAGLRSRGFQRHARPIEVMTVIIDYLRNGDSSRYAVLAKSMLSGKGEWVSAAFRKYNNLLEVALDPENLVLDNKNNVYVVNGNILVSGVVKSFDIGNKSSGSWIDLGEFPDDLVEYLYGNKFKDLPKEMQEGSKMAQLYFRENVWWPVGCGSGNSYFNLYANFSGRVSRGVREK